MRGSPLPIPPTSTWRSLVAAFALAPAAAAATPPDAGRQEALAHLLAHDCGSCHGLTMKGGLGPPLTPAALAERDDAILVETILDGRPGTPMPPWRSELSRGDAEWLVDQLRKPR